MRKNLAVWGMAVVLVSCGPDLAGLARGETAAASEVQGPTRIALDNGLVVILAEVHAPDGATRAAEEALTALTLGRQVRLGYGERRSVPLRDGRQAALAHVYVRSEGGRWLWAQGELVEAGLVLARPRPGEAALASPLLSLEGRARQARRGVWDEPEHQPRSIEVLALEETLLPDSCRRGPFRLVEGQVDHVAQSPSGVYLNFGPPGMEDQDVTVRITPEDATAWASAGFAPDSYAGGAVRARGSVGNRGGPLLCLEHPAALERLEALP